MSAAPTGEVALSYRITRRLDEFRGQLSLLVAEDEVDQILQEELVLARQKVRDEVRKQMEPMVKICSHKHLQAWVEGEHGTRVGELHAMRLGREIFQVVHAEERKRILNECSLALARDITPTNCVGEAIIKKLSEAVQVEVDKLVTAWIESDGPTEIAERAMEDLGPIVEGFDVNAVAGLVMKDLPARATAMFNFAVAKAVLSRSLQPLEVHVQAVTTGDVDLSGMKMCGSCSRWAQPSATCQCGNYIYA